MSLYEEYEDKVREEVNFPIFKKTPQPRRAPF